MNRPHFYYNHPCQFKIYSYICTRFQKLLAEIAQLVEHDLAKVGVAGSSPVFRSWSARMVESVDTKDLKSFGLTAVRVQVPLRVLILPLNLLILRLFLFPWVVKG